MNIIISVLTTITITMTRLKLPPDSPSAAGKEGTVGGVELEVFVELDVLFYGFGEGGVKRGFKEKI